jgi:Tfp pilus assembly protein PilX
MLIILGIIVVVVPLLAFAATRWMDRKEARSAPQRAAEDAERAEQRKQHDAARKEWEVRRLRTAAEQGDEMARLECEALEAQMALEQAKECRDEEERAEAKRVWDQNWARREREAAAVRKEEV